MEATGFWRLRGSYSYLYMNVYRSPNSLDVEPPARISGASPQHQVTSSLHSTSPRNCSWISIYRYVSALPALGVPAYSTGDARFGWRFSEQFELSLVGQNLFQPWHFEYGGTVRGIVRNVYARSTWSR